MYKLILTLFLCILSFSAFTQERFSQEERQEFLSVIKQEIEEGKKHNNGVLTFELIKPEYYDDLDHYFSSGKLTTDELLQLKQTFETLSKSNVPSDKVADVFLASLERDLLEINKRTIPLAKEGELCNDLMCVKGLTCAVDPIQVAVGGRKKVGSECKQNSECASYSCVEDSQKEGKKICEEVFRCYAPLSLGQSCNVNPVCGAGTCLPYDLMTSGIGECKEIGKSCKASRDCCSNSCVSGRCEANFQCKSCINSGARVDRNQKCCEGLYRNEAGICVPDLPPRVIKEVNNRSILPKAIGMLAGLFISPAYAQNDDIYNTVKTNRQTYSNFHARSEVETSTQDIKTKRINLKFTRKSNFETCEMRFKDDFYNAMALDGSIDLEIAMLAFDFVITGDADNDYWKTNKNDDRTSLHARLKKVGQNHIELRKKNHAEIEVINQRLTCMCQDVKGFENIEGDENKASFKENCSEEYAKYEKPEDSIDDLNGDASGLKGQRMLTYWTEQLQDLHMQLAYDNTVASQELYAISNWTNSSAKWSDSQDRNYDLYSFIVKNPSGSIAALGALVGALLAAGVMAVLGGFNVQTLLSTWASVGILSSAGAAGVGVWLIASLKGAWITSYPQIMDDYVKPVQVKCNYKKDKCHKHTRTLIQPYNNICDIHTSSNACVKSFLAIPEGEGENVQFRYIVDPWVPAGVSKSAILGNQPIYTTLLEQSYKKAKDQMVSIGNDDINGRGRSYSQFLNGKASTESRLKLFETSTLAFNKTHFRNKMIGRTKSRNKVEFKEGYMQEQFIDARIVGLYAPALKPGNDLYLLNKKKKALILEAAKKFAIEQGVMEEGDTENLEAFAEYAYEYHFILPKRSRPGEIGYPTVALQTYINYLTNDVAGNLSVGVADRAVNLGNLGKQYAENYLNTLTAYGKDKSLTAGQNNTFNKEVEKAKKDLNRYMILNSIVGDKGLVSELTNLNDGFLESRGALVGVNNGSSALNSNDKNFLRAIGNLRTQRQQQKKALDHYKKEMASNGNSERAEAMEKAANNFSSRFSQGAAGTASSGSSLGGLGSSSRGGSEGSAANSNSGTFNSGSSFGGANYGSSFGGGFGSGNYGSRGGFGLDSSNSGSSGNYNVADNNKIQEAIDSRNKMNKDRYSSESGNTIFEKITNAYIRNYDKVLIKRSDKDIIENTK